jgi:phospholipase/lecithinase/hemolysin
MPFQRLRRAMLVAGCVSPAILAACGGGDVVKPFQPVRVVALDGAESPWVQQVASHYGVSAVGRAGGSSFALGSALVSASNGSAPSLAARVQLAIDSGLSADDLVMVSAGPADIAAAGATQASVEAAAREVVAQVRRLIEAGARQVLVSDSYDLGLAPAAISSLLTNAFNESLLREFALSGTAVTKHVQTVETRQLVQLIVFRNGVEYGISNVTAAGCSGTSNGEVSGTVCPVGTTAAVADPSVHLFADGIYLTRTGQLQVGDSAVSAARRRWG